MYVSFWIIPLIITIVSFIPAMVYKRNGDWDFGPILETFLAIFVSLVSWLLYFIVF